MLKKTLIVGLLAFAASASALAADYFVVLPLKGKTTAESNIQVVLNAVSLPNAEVGLPYAYDLKPALKVTGDSAYTGAGVVWSVLSSTLPAGLILTSDGIIKGTPEVEGQSAITARATYKTKSGQQTYQLVTVGIKVSLVDTTLPAATPGAAYMFDFKTALQVEASSFNASDVTWTATGVPVGLSLSAGGVLSGVAPTLASDETAISVKASYRNKSAQRNYVLTYGDPYWAQTAALLRMDGTGTAIVDAKGGSFASQGVTLSSTAQFGQSANFPGITAKGVIGPALNLSADFTMEAWVRPNTVAGVRILMGQWSQSTPSLAANLLYIQDGRLIFCFAPYSPTAGLMSGGLLAANTWSHVAVSRNKSTFRMFVNGTMVATAEFAGAGTVTTTPYALGDYFNYSNQFGVSNYAFAGYMDEVRVTRASRYNGNFTTPSKPFPAK